MTNKLIVTIGGTNQFNDEKLAFSAIDKALKTHKITKKNLQEGYVYGYQDGKNKENDNIGAFKIAQLWAEKNKVRFLDGSPKNGDDFKALLAQRNNALASSSKLLVNLRIGSKNGGKGIIEAFELKGVPVELVDESGKTVQPTKVNAGESNNEVTEADASPAANRKGVTPSTEDVKRSVEIYSKVAQKLLNYGCLMLDTETTGLKEDDEVIEIALSDCATGATVFNSLIYSDKESNPFAFRVNNITREMLEGQPTIDKVWTQIEAVVGNRVILASNAPFDERLLNQSLRKHGLTCSFIWADIQTLYRNYSCQGSSKDYPLKTIGMCKQLKVEAGTHRALNDVQAQIRLLRAMSEGVIPDFEV